MLKQLEWNGHKYDEIEQFKREINITKNLSNFMVYQLKDLDDWHHIKQGSFRKVSARFDLKEGIREISDMMNLKAENKNINFRIDQTYEG